jgi:hypothetical protein
MEDCSISLALLHNCAKTLMATYALFHVIDEIGLWQLKKKQSAGAGAGGGDGEG